MQLSDGEEGAQLVENISPGVEGFGALWSSLGDDIVTLDCSRSQCQSSWFNKNSINILAFLKNVFTVLNSE